MVVMVALLGAPATAWAGAGGGGGAQVATGGTDHYLLGQVEGGWYERKVNLHLAVRGGRIVGDDEGYAGWAVEVTGGVRAFPVCALHLCLGAGVDAGWARHQWTTPVTVEPVESFVALPVVVVSARPARRWRVNVATGLRVTGDHRSGWMFGLAIVVAADEATPR